MARLKDKVALITGGGSGIGQATAQLLAAEGAKVMVTDIDDAKTRATVREIEEAGGQARRCALDVTSEADWQQALDATQDAFGLPSVLVNNAGLLLYSELMETSVDQWHKLMDVNALGVFLGMKHGGKLMSQNGGGSIVNLSSTAAHVGVPRQVVYGATKGAIRTMTKDAAMELAPHQVRVNSVHPSIVNTRMADYGSQERGKSKEEIGQMYPLGRIGEPMDVAYAVLYLASDESSFVTGTEMVVDGGFTAQ
jgi:NAD(P)-dependent dehydrogenase (short-subunit alcohol dehydrogenase family)